MVPYALKTYNHMSDAVLAEYEIRGVTKENMVISKALPRCQSLCFWTGIWNDEVIYLEN